MQKHKHGKVIFASSMYTSDLNNINKQNNVFQKKGIHQFSNAKIMELHLKALIVPLATFFSLLIYEIS